MGKYIKFIVLFLVLIVIGFASMNLYHKMIQKDNNKIDKSAEKFKFGLDENNDSKKEEESNDDTSKNETNEQEEQTTLNQNINQQTTTTEQKTQKAKYEISYIYPNTTNNSDDMEIIEVDSDYNNSQEQVIQVEEENDLALYSSSISTNLEKNKDIETDEYSAIEIKYEENTSLVSNVNNSSSTNKNTSSNNTSTNVNSSNNKNTTSSNSNKVTTSNKNTTSNKTTTNNKNSSNKSIYTSNFKNYSTLTRYNQSGNSFSSKSVCANGGNSVAATGCGLSAYMATRYVLTGKHTNYMDFANEACRTGFYNGLGSEFGKAVDNKHNYEKKYGIEGKSIAKDYNTIIKELKKGRVVDVLVHCGYKTINNGGFNATSNGHYIALINYNTDNKKVYVYNPNGYNTGWQPASIIKKYVVSCSRGMWSMKASEM